MLDFYLLRVATEEKKEKTKRRRKTANLSRDFSNSAKYLIVENIFCLSFGKRSQKRWKLKTKEQKKKEQLSKKCVLSDRMSPLQQFAVLGLSCFDLSQKRIQWLSLVISLWEYLFSRDIISSHLIECSITSKKGTHFYYFYILFTCKVSARFVSLRRKKEMSSRIKLFNVPPFFFFP